METSELLIGAHRCPPARSQRHSSSVKQVCLTGFGETDCRHVCRTKNASPRVCVALDANTRLLTCVGDVAHARALAPRPSGCVMPRVTTFVALCALTGVALAKCVSCAVSRAACRCARALPRRGRAARCVGDDARRVGHGATATDARTPARHAQPYCSTPNADACPPGLAAWITRSSSWTSAAVRVARTSSCPPRPRRCAANCSGTLHLRLTASARVTGAKPAAGGGKMRQIVRLGLARVENVYLHARRARLIVRAHRRACALSCPTFCPLPNAPFACCAPAQRECA